MLCYDLVFHDMLCSVVFVEGARRDTWDHRDNLGSGGRGMRGVLSFLSRARGGIPGTIGTT